MHKLIQLLFTFVNKAYNIIEFPKRTLFILNKLTSLEKI